MAGTEGKRHPMSASEPGGPVTEAPVEAVPVEAAAVGAAPERIHVGSTGDDGPELVFPEPEPEPRKPRFKLNFTFPRIGMPRIRIPAAVLHTVLALSILFAVVAAIAALIWFLAVPLFFRMVLQKTPPPLMPRAAATRPPTPRPSPSPTLMPLPPEAPDVDKSLDPLVEGPFAFRLADVNRAAGRKIVTYAEYHDSDAGQRYYTAIVTSCKDLLALWPLQNGSLARMTLKFHLDEFERFVFVERFSEGQWGLSSCDETM
jgi:hypothetical protein